MVHARMIRPAVAGATPVKVDESSIKDIPGARVYREKGFLAVVADKEWDAIKAVREAQGAMVGRQAAVHRPGDALRSHPQHAGAQDEVEGKPVGDVDAAFKNAARVIEAEYEWPFQSHACMGPACAVVEIKDDEVTCWTGSQKPHFVRNGIARTIGVPVDKVRSIWVVGPGSYGRSDADDAAMDAAVLAKATGRPVRVQYTRDQGTGWDPKGPASIHRARAAIDANGNINAYDFFSKGFSRIDVNTNGSQPLDTLAGPFPRRRRFAPATTSAHPRRPMCSPTSGPRGRRSRRSSIAARRCAPRTCAIPIGPQVHFASESFMDEVAAALKVDPAELRLRYLKAPRDIAVIKAALAKGGVEVAAVAAHATRAATP